MIVYTSISHFTATTLYFGVTSTPIRWHPSTPDSILLYLFLDALFYCSSDARAGAVKVPRAGYPCALAYCKPPINCSVLGLVKGADWVMAMKMELSGWRTKSPGSEKTAGSAVPLQPREMYKPHSRACVSVKPYAIVV